MEEQEDYATRYNRELARKQAQSEQVLRDKERRIQHHAKKKLMVEQPPEPSTEQPVLKRRGFLAKLLGYANG